MKDYMSTHERDSLFCLGKLIDLMHGMIIDWEGRGNLTKEEAKSLKMARSWGYKGWQSIFERQNPNSKKAFDRVYNNSELKLEMKSILEVYNKKKHSECQRAYDENKEYMRLVELIMHHNCRGCNKKCAECEFYEQFEEQFIPEFTGTKRSGQCKYSYILEDDNNGGDKRCLKTAEKKELEESEN